MNKMNVTGLLTVLLASYGGASAVAQSDTTDGSTMQMDGAMDMNMNMGGDMEMSPLLAPPPSVMGGHGPKEGEFMFSLSQMGMSMDGNRNGTSDISDADVLVDYMVAPLDMTMDMTMGNAMYGVTDDISVMLMVPYVSKSMNLQHRMQGKFSTSSKGLGDVTVAGGYQVYRSDPVSVQLGLGLSLPTGSIDERDNTPAGINQMLAYPMQLGSGTYDLKPTVTYTGMTMDYSWGAQVGATIRLGENDRDYTLGNIYQASLWGSRKMSDWFGLSAGFQGEVEKNIDGNDSELNATMAPTADSNLRGGKRVNFLAGTNFTMPTGTLAGQVLSIQAEVPIYQNLDGPQLQREYTYRVAWQASF
jgi:hypothetical protein